MAAPSIVDGCLEDLATIRVALLPVGTISREVYERYAALVRRQQRLFGSRSLAYHESRFRAC